MNRNLKCLFLATLLSCALINCSSKKIPDWAIGNWDCSEISFEVSQDYIALKELNFPKLNWNEEVSATIMDLKTSMLAQVTNISSNIFEFTIKVNTPAGNQTQKFTMKNVENDKIFLNMNGTDIPLKKK